MVSYRFYKEQEAIIWSTGELKFITDKKHYDALSPERQQVLDRVLAFFIPGDGVVVNNIVTRFMIDCTSMEERMVYSAQLFIETVHAETYGLIAYTLYNDTKLKELHRLADESPYSRAMLEFMEKWTYSERSWPERLLAYACSEGIFFNAQFLPIFWFRKDSLLPNIVHLNELIRHDELLHRDYGCNRHRHYGGIEPSLAIQIVDEAYQVALPFSLWSTESVRSEFTEEGLKSYVGVISDQVLVKSGYEAYYKTKNPYPWMDDANLVQKLNFFESNAGNYVRFSVTDALDIEARTGRKEVSEDVYNDPSSIDF